MPLEELAILRVVGFGRGVAGETVEVIQRTEHDAWPRSKHEAKPGR
ncbi:MAG TPA: hypothetical protein VFA28_14575 [Bryobacteraceae bacterium]|nr:hypothetical protein [Bryobacteraceae bacterium]